MVSRVNWNSNRETHAPDWTCPYCGKTCGGSCGGWGGKRHQHVTITRQGHRWNWQRHTPGTVWTSRESYVTELDAAIDAIGIARCYGVAVRLPLHLRKPIVDHFRGVGYLAYVKGNPFEDCRNEFERLGWTLAALEDQRLTAQAEALFVERESPFSVESEWRVEVHA